MLFSDGGKKVAAVVGEDLSVEDVPQGSIAFFLSEGKTIYVIPKAGESAAAAKKRVAEHHKVPLKHVRDLVAGTPMDDLGDGTL